MSTIPPDQLWAKDSAGNTTEIGNDASCVGFQKNCPKPPALAMTSAVMNGAFQWLQKWACDFFNSQTCEAPIIPDEEAALFESDGHLVACDPNGEARRYSMARLISLVCGSDGITEAQFNELQEAGSILACLGGDVLRVPYSTLFPPPPALIGVQWGGYDATPATPGALPNYGSLPNALTVPQIEQAQDGDTVTQVTDADSGTGNNRAGFLVFDFDVPFGVGESFDSFTLIPPSGGYGAGGIATYANDDNAVFTSVDGFNWTQVPAADVSGGGIGAAGTPLQVNLSNSGNVRYIGIAYAVNFATASEYLPFSEIEVS